MESGEWGSSAIQNRPSKIPQFTSTFYAPMPPLTLPENYDRAFHHLKERIHQSQTRAALAINCELVLLYWEIGAYILQQQQQHGWGAKVITRLSKDLSQSFPDIKGFSSRNLKYMRAFAEAYPDQEVVQQLAAQIPWFHNCILLDKVKDQGERTWYIQKTMEQGWSRNVLSYQIESGLYQRQGGAITNFDRTLPQKQSDLAHQLLKDPYTFDFLNLGEAAQERDLEAALVNHIRDFLLELGVGFAFVGSQYHLEIGDEDFYIDLLFYHLRLRCFVVIDLKMKAFKPEFSGKMNFYVSAIDDLLRHPNDNPTIGIILCKAKNKTVVEYALRDVNKPIGVSTHQFSQQLPEALQGQLPTIEQLETELNTVMEKRE
jgi:predicted nuclease of restriction endonuclease-like (RecB) superfamily